MAHLATVVALTAAATTAKTAAIAPAVSTEGSICRIISRASTTAVSPLLPRFGAVTRNVPKFSAVVALPVLLAPSATATTKVAIRLVIATVSTTIAAIAATTPSARPLRVGWRGAVSKIHLSLLHNLGTQLLDLSTFFDLGALGSLLRQHTFEGVLHVINPRLALSGLCG